MDKEVREMYAKLEGHQKEVVRWIRRTRPTIYTVLRHVSSSGMLRVIDIYAMRQGDMVWLTPIVETLTGYKRDKKRDGLRVGGCGMDMGFKVVYDFSWAVFPTGFRYRKGEYHRNNSPSPRDNNGGYALKQKWL